MFRAVVPVFLSLSLVDIPVPPQVPEPTPQILRGGGARLGIQAVGEHAADFAGRCRHCFSELKEDRLPPRLSLPAQSFAVFLGGLDADDGKGVIQPMSSSPVEVMCERATHAIAVTGVSSARLDSRQSNFLNCVLGPEVRAIIRSCGTVNLADGIKLVRRLDHAGDPTLITNLPRLQTQAAEFERELKRRAAEGLAAAQPQE